MDLGDMENEVRSAEDAAKKAVADAQRLSEELRRQQDAASSSEKQRRSFETQVRCNANTSLPPSYMRFCTGSGLLVNDFTTVIWRTNNSGTRKFVQII